MSTKISGISSQTASPVGAGRPVQRSQDAVSGGGSSADTSAEGSQSVQITGTAQQLSELDVKVRSFPAVNEAKVSQLRSSLEQGTYQVRPQHIADQLVAMERSLSQLPDAEESAGAGA